METSQLIFLSNHYTLVSIWQRSHITSLRIKYYSFPRSHQHNTYLSGVLQDSFPEKLFSSITYSPFKSFILLLKAEFPIVFNNLVKEKIPGISVKVGCNCKYYSCKTPTNQFSFFQSFYIFVSSITSEILIYIIRS